jgi:hypothetical protein
MDASRLSLPARVVMTLAVLPALLCAGNGAQVGRADTSPPPGQAAVRAAPEALRGVVDGRVRVVRPVARHDHRGAGPAAVLIAALGGAAAAAIRRWRIAWSWPTDGRLGAVRSRGPPWLRAA